MTALSLRLLTPEDAALLLEWRNHPLCRAQSLHTHCIEWGQHQQWLTGFLVNPQAVGVLAIHQHQPVSHYRAHLHTDGRVMLSWMTSPQHFGQGFGKRGLGEFLQKFNCELFAQIKTGNEASLRMATHGGFQCVEQAQGLGLWRREGPVFNPLGPGLKGHFNR